MKSERVETTLGSLLSLSNGKSSPERSNNLPYPVYGGNGVIGFSNEVNSNPGTIIIGRVGSYCGSVHFSDSSCWVTDNAIRAKAMNGNNPRFLFYMLQTLHLNNYQAGSGQPLLNQTILSQIPATIPAPSEQRRIAHILGTLDDKIELNRQMNETLESTARAIFKSWFVNVDPVKAKMEGRTPACMDVETAALFPSAFQDSPLGQIPEGWDVEKVGDLIEIVKGRSYRSIELNESDVALVTLKSIMRGGGYRPDGLKPYTGKYNPEQIITPGELVVSYTDVTQDAEVVGKPAIVRGDENYKTLVASLDLGIIRPVESTVSILFLYCLFRERRFQSHIYGYADGTTVLHLSKDGVPSYQFALPPEEIRSLFDSIAEPIFAKIESNENESRTLAQTRDTLLPKLLSGEIRVDDAVEILEETDGGQS